MPALLVLKTAGNTKIYVRVFTHCILANLVAQDVLSDLGTKCTERSVGVNPVHQSKDEDSLVCRRMFEQLSSL